ncbi:MAG: glycoside hydrolase family 78 protein [Bacteroidota bacterium]|nr:glycoside hydrolase family 78 protein [Bacteroidota bacterium]
MRKYILFLAAGFGILAPVLLTNICFGQKSPPLRLVQLTCESIVSPQSVDLPSPRMSWQLLSPLRNVEQSAYRILVSSSPEKAAGNIGDLWDSGKQLSSRSILIPYAGSVLGSRQRCYWKVKVWTVDGNVSEWSPVTQWGMGLLNPKDWKASWIGYDGVFSSAEKPDDHFTRLAARYLRKEFVAKKAIKKAVAYISGVGLYELYLNGNKTGNEVLAPGPTDYAKRVFYNRFDVTAQLQRGGNAIGVILGNGRFVPLRQHLEDTTNNCVNYGFPKLLLQLEIEYTDGEREQVCSDASWMISGDGPITANNEYDGEEYDATKEFKGWTRNGFVADSRWRKVQLVSPAAPVVQAQLNPPIKIMQTMKAGPRTMPKAGVYVFDMKQNMVGWVQLKVKGARGTVVQLRFAERLKPDGMIYTDNLGDARVTDSYTLRGNGTETWEPRFTYHGFRYVEITGLPYAPASEDVLGKVVHDDLKLIGQISTSNEVLNKIYHNMYWGIRGNYRGIPTDCPQRDERMGWLGDRAAVGTGESFMFNTHLLYAKWMQDIEDAQNDAGSIPDVAPAYWRMYTDNTTWPSAYVYNIRMLYQQFGDDAPIRKHYASIKKWLAYLKDRFMKDGIITENTYGDWCVPPETLTLIFSQDPARKTPGDYLSTAFYYDMVNIMAGFAGVVGNVEDSVYFNAEAKELKQKFNKKFFNSSQNYYANNTTTANVLALAFNLVPEDLRTAVFAHVVDNTMNKAHGHISTGLVGIQQLMRTLTANGRPDIAYLLATTTSYPGWGYMLTQGATTIWELWNGNTADPAMNSANHVMMIGDLLTWYYENLAGIKAAAPAFSRITMRPLMADGLKFVKASYDSPYGPIVSDWKKDEQGFGWKIEIPANTKASVYVPVKAGQIVKERGRTLGGVKAVTVAGRDAGYLIIALGSGKYHFRTR